jgi:ATP-dependent exoDNAse (exonuclease V) beta subunit
LIEIKTTNQDFHKLVQERSFLSHEDFLILTKDALPEAFIRYKDHFLHLPIYELVEVLIRCFDLNQIEAEWAYLQSFQDAVLEFSKNHRSDLQLFLDWWQENGFKRSVRLTGALDAVEIITSHKSKGLQYPIVLVPFCNFSMDSRFHTAWYPTPEEPFFENIRHVPLIYAQELENTVFRSAYRKQMAKWYLESLNVLYVAFTRAERALIVFCEPPPKKPVNMHDNVSKLLWEYFSDQQPEGWSEEGRYFRKGGLEVKPGEAQHRLSSLKQYHSHKWSDKLRIRKQSTDIGGDEKEQFRQTGILFHKILSEIIHFEEAEEVTRRYEARMELTAEEKTDFLNIFQKMLCHEEVKSWFSGRAEVKTEVLVLPGQGEFRRMDRVMLEGTLAKVVDFKSGLARQGDQQQVKEYMRILEDMGYEVRGFILYLRNGELHEVR